jgi:hypothetical protein
VVSLAGAGAVWVAWRGRGERAVALAALAAGAFFAGLWAAAPAFLVGRNADAIAGYLREHARPDEPIYCLGTCVYSLALGLGDTVDAVQYDGELDFGIKQLSPQERVRRFPTVDEFRPLWESERTVWLVADRKDPVIRSGAPLADGPPVLQRGSLLLLCNRPRTAP